VAATATWPIVELGDVCHVQLGKMLSPKSKKGVRPIPYLRNENVQWNRFDLADVSWMDFSESEEDKFRLQPGDLLVCEGGEPGRAAVWNGEIERCCYQKALHRIRPRERQLFPPFLMYRLWMSAFDAEFTRSHSKTTIAHLPREKLLRLRFPLPPYDEQQRLAAALSQQLAAADAAKHVAEEQLRLIDTISASLLRAVFGGNA
jgi:type I restriction enzyme S subunit